MTAIVDDPTDTIIERTEAAQLGPTLAQALDGMPSHDRDALRLFAWNDLSYEEVAVALNVPVGTIGSRISRARLRLGARLAELGCRPEQTRS
jgi:RNA polymerase sigma-70 factor (ECF subfamily)